MVLRAFGSRSVDNCDRSGDEVGRCPSRFGTRTPRCRAVHSQANRAANHCWPGRALVRSPHLAASWAAASRPAGGGMTVAALAVRCLLAAVLAVAGASKLLSPAATASAARQFGLGRRLAVVAAVAVPVLELIAAAALLSRTHATVGAALAVALLTAFTAVTANAVRRGRPVDCQCFGSLTRSPVTARTVARNAVLLTLGIAALTASALDSRPAGLALDQLSPLAWVVVALALSQLLTLSLGVRAFTSLLTQHGRLLLRLDELAGDGRHSGHAEHRPATRGLAPGERAPSFTLPGVRGETHSLESLAGAGAPVLLVFTDPGCGPCEALSPSVRQWQRDLRSRLSVAVVSRGTAAEVTGKAEQHRLTTVLVDQDGAVARAYRSPGTPSAVLVDEKGRIARPLAAGAVEISSLVESLNTRPAAAPAERAPAFRLTALDGSTVDQDWLARGRDSVVLFWDPDCGFCARMTPRLQRWDLESDGTRPLLVVTSGRPEQARDLGLRAPVLVADGTVMRAFGATGTPMAVAFDGEGRVASPLAAGEQAVLDLLGPARSGLRPPLPLLEGTRP